MKIKRTPLFLSNQGSGFALMISMPRSEVLLRVKMADHASNRFVSFPAHSDNGEKVDVDVSISHIVMIDAEYDWEAEPNTPDDITNIKAGQIIWQ